MDSVVRRKLEMGERVRAFIRAHPIDDPSYGSIVAKFEDRLERAEALAVQERGGRIAQSSAVKRRRELKRQLDRQLIRHLRKVGALAGKVQPELAARFTTVSRSSANKVFLTAARAIATDAKEVRDLLIEHGMSAAMFDELTATVDALEKANEEVRNGQLDHVGARAELGVVTGEVLELVGLLNGLIQYRFRDDPERLGSWASARNVVGPFKAKVDQLAPGPATSPKPGDNLPTAA